MKAIRYICLGLCLLSGFLPARAQLEKVQAAFIYNFTKFMEWPEDQRKGDFIIGVVNNDAMVSSLNEMVAGKLVGLQKIVVKSFSTINSLTDCHMVYLSVNESENIENLASRINDKNTVILGCKEGLAKRGAHINFIILNQKQGFEINKAGITSRGITLSSRLEQLASKVY